MTVSNETTREITAAWQHTIESSQESGIHPALLVGQSDTLLDGLPALSACRRLAQTRADLASPQMWAGGRSAWWSAALIYGVRQIDMIEGQTASPTMAARFAGVDSATVMASMTLQAPARRIDAEGDWLNGLPAGMAPYLQPRSLPGAVLPWAALPFSVAGDDQTDSDSAGIDWTAVATWILALCILIMAFIL